MLHAGSLQLRQAGATPHCDAQASHCRGFSCRGARALGARASVVVARGLSSCGSQAPEHRLSSCGARAQLLHGMWDPPGAGLEPVPPALAGGFSTTVPAGKSLLLVLNFLQTMLPHFARAWGRLSLQPPATPLICHCFCRGLNGEPKR